jgi:hypothetical protein
LRFEFLNNSRNKPFYSNDLLAPANYESDYLFATVMFSSPLAWFEIQNYPATDFKKVSKLIKLWKQHRDDIFNGTVLPIGSQPDGVSWTGFCSYAGNKKAAVVLVFRELNNNQSHDFDLDIPGLKNFTVKKLAGKGSARIREGKLHIKLAKSLSFILLQIKLKK